MSRKKIITVISFWILLIAVSCSGRTSEFQAFVNFDDRTWHRNDTVQFTYTPGTGGKKNFYFYLENTTDYPYANIFIIAKTRKNNKLIIDTLEYEMTDGHGRWLGRKVRHAIENLLIYKTGVKTVEGERIELSLEPATRRIDRIEGDTSLPGILRVGLIVESQNKTE